MRSFYSPLAISTLFYEYLKLLKLHRMERSRSKDVTSGNQTQDLLHQSLALTDCAILAPVHVDVINFVMCITQLLQTPIIIGQKGFWSHVTLALTYN